ncbi:protein LONG AFTER FAR-RED 3 isoform X3 [Dendrobium catenatum]|uniref:protein LONG AFTER FAR-RED 3 isoform X3 n=1 Tax=Dendrobium catenatum TaxID=906689 RepID=UPI0010A06FB2|nr:protein LONG AFTER FAR-RED 3 isoform X3 [Dendrobium catenatum]
MATGRGLVSFISAAAAAILAIFVFLLLNPSRRHLIWFRDSAADLVVRNATIYTSVASIPFAEAMAVRNGRILRIGTDAHVRGLIGYRTHELNLEGKVVLPGFIDSHVHLISGGLQMGRVKLQGIKSKEDFVMTVKEAVKDKLPGDWLLGGGWNNDIWGGELPDASWIDDITRDNPVWFVRMDGHMGLANSLALKLAGITNSSLDPVGGTILTTSNGADPTGLLIDSAMKLVLTVIPEISVHERQEALIRASKYALMNGVTTMVDMGRYFPGASVDDSWQDLSDVYKWADSSGKMLIRVCLFFPLQTWSRLRDLFEDKGRSLSQWIYLGGVKAFADGSLGSNSALFHEVAVHAIGDKANDMVLDLFNSVKSINEGRDHRFRIEHAQHLVPEAISRFGVQSVIASVQVNELKHAYYWFYIPKFLDF